MSAKHLSQIKQLFDQCEPLSQQHREQVLNQSTLDQTIVDEVKALLAIADSEQEHQATIISKQMMDMSQNMPAGQVLDVYQIDREIGRGGMGIVFRAHRSDGAYQQKVAIKVSPSFASDEEQQRFQQERQILAKLQHPNIATLLGGGATEDKRPYIVMEYIEGQTLTQYCADKKLSLTARLMLFLDVCTAISYAHRHLIVHRDIKPENVLVNADGQVKLLDFGVGKVLQTSHLDHTQAFTTFSLAYASPEQVNGEATSTATDVYGLGALLYELLTGRPPHKIDNQNTEQIIKAICTQMPVKPSAVIQNNAENNVQHTVNRAALKGDLDNVLAKALAKEPERRYASAIEFAQDIQHFLNGEAVVATPSSFSYQLKKLIQRHPITSGLSVALSSSVVLGLIVSLNLSNNLNIEKKKLEQEVATSEQVINLLTQMFEQATPEKAQGQPIDIQDFVNSAVGQTKNALTNQPAVKARLLETLVKVTSTVGQNTNAIVLQKELIQLKQAEHKDVLPIDNAILGNLIFSAGEAKQGTQIVEQAHQQLGNRVNATIDDKVMIKYLLSSIYMINGEIEKSLKLANQALKLFETSSLVDNAKNQRQLIRLKQSLAEIYSQKNQPLLAIEILESILTLLPSLQLEQSELKVSLMSDLALNYFYVNKTQLALETGLKGYQLSQRILELNNRTRIYSVSRYADVLKKNGKVKEAIFILEKELALQPENFGYLLYLRQRAPSYIDVRLL